ncbi:unnamed protein product [Pedinophyceae sp. YPF-701]|nr:unnamed protein product [Pedinophyceae sp. YPF-701]
MPTAQEVTSLYRAILRGGKKFHNYNIREYILRRAKDRFREGASLTGDGADKAYAKGLGDLEVLRRQQVVHSLYHRPQRSYMEIKDTAPGPTGN